MTSEVEKKPRITGKAIAGGTIILLGLFVVIDAVAGYVMDPFTILGKTTIGLYAIQAIVGILIFAGGLHLWQKRRD